MKTLIRRAKNLEVKSGVNSEETWLSAPPENDLYTVIRITPPSSGQVKKELTEAEYGQFKEELEGELIEARWYE